MDSVKWGQNFPGASGRTLGLFFVSRNMGSVQPVQLGGLMPSVTVLKYLIIFFKKRVPLFPFSSEPCIWWAGWEEWFWCDTVGRVKPALDPGPHDLVPDLEGCIEWKLQEELGVEREACHGEQEINTSIFSAGKRTFPLHWVSFELMPAVRTGLQRLDVFSLGDKCS